MALDELKVLQAKVKAFDAVYEGIDNDGDGTPDTIGGTLSGCVPQTTGNCPPFQDSLVDPTCGTATLDFLENTEYTCSDLSARDYICNTYNPDRVRKSGSP